MSEEEKLQLENECLLKYTKAQMIQKYIDELEENKRIKSIHKDTLESHKELRERIEKATNKIQYIIDYGFDYDGFNNVEDLKMANDNLYCANKMLEKENKRLHSIIKEVREYIENELWNYFDERNIYLKVRDEFLEMLEQEK